MIKHKMKLHNEPFLAMKSGLKTIEMRLNDEKRSLIKVGDIIEFTNTTSKEILEVRVLNLFYYSDFFELYKHHNKISIGYNETDIADPKDMMFFYSDEDIAKYGVLAIEIEV